MYQVAPDKKKPITEYLKGQGRYRHLFTPKNKHIVDELQRHTDARWTKLLQKVEQTA
jgi:pyruvate ferredoxin oxidoreductase beta subunit